MTKYKCYIIMDAQSKEKALERLERKISGTQEYGLMYTDGFKVEEVKNGTA